MEKTPEPPDYSDPAAPGIAVTRANPSATGATVDGEMPGPHGPIPVRHDPHPAPAAEPHLDDTPST